MNRRKNLWAIVALAIAAASIWAVGNQSKSFSVKFLVMHIKNADKRWLIMAFLCMFGFIWFEGLAVVRIAKALGYQRSSQQGMVYGAADVYFSAITPSASGGQPASAYFMLRDGMGGSAVTSTLLLNLILYSIALLMIGSVSFLLKGRILLQLSAGSRILFGIGVIILIGLIIVFHLLLHEAKILYSICDKLLSFFERFGWIRSGQKKRERLHDSMKRYKACAKIIASNKRMLAEALFFNILQRISQLGVSFMVFMACGRGLGKSLQAMAMQCFVAVGSNSIPVPGAMGVADYIMLDGFEYLVGSRDAVTMELLCRGITFYGCVLTGGVITICGYLAGRMREKRFMQST